MPGTRVFPFDGFIDGLRAPEDADQPVWPRLRVYLPGSQVGGLLYAPDGARLGEGLFRVQAYAGSGFAGQVYRADVQGDTNVVLGTGGPVALKILRPAGQGKLWFRDFLFLLSYQMTFAARLRAPAVRAGQLLNLIIRDVVVREGFEAAMIANPRGYFWDADLRSFVEIYDWEMGRSQRYTPDDQLIQRWLNPNTTAPLDEMQRKRVFMGWLVGVCNRLGAEGVARQYAWDTWISQANVLTRLESTGTAEFVAIDWRPGLAVPFFLPLSPAHARLILHGIRHGRWVLFDHLDVLQLQHFTAGLKHPGKAFPGQVRQLLVDDQQDRDARPDLWQAGDRLLADHNRRLIVQEALISDWQRLGRISTGRALGLQNRRVRFWVHFALSLLPWFGPWLQSVLDHPGYRRHLRDWLLQPGYREPYLEALRARDLAEWIWFERVTPEQAGSLADSNGAYLAQKLGLSWLPPALHRLATDPKRRREWMRNTFILPVQLILDEATRLAWLGRVLEVQVERGALSESEVEFALERMRTPRLRGFARDLGFSAGLEVFSRLLYILLGLYGAAVGSFWPLLIAMLGPVSPSGIIRFLYIGGQLVCESPLIWHKRKWKLLTARLSGMLIAPWRFVGNFCVPVEMFAFEPQVSLLVAEYLAFQLVQMIPVLGGRNKLLEFVVFQLTFNLPLSLRHTFLTGVYRAMGSRDREQ